MAKILITGHRGYLGACLYESFAKLGDFEIVPLEERLENLQPNSLDCDYIFHCAGALRHRKDEHHCGNTLGTQRLLEACSKKTHVFYFSSKSVYGRPLQNDVCEAIPAHPLDSYAQSKLAAEQLIQQGQHPWTILRISTLWGKGVADNYGLAFVSTLLPRLLSGEPCTRLAGDLKMDYLYVWDCVALLKLMIQQPSLVRNKVFNVGGEVVSTHYILEQICQRAEQIKQESVPIEEVEATVQFPFFMSVDALASCFNVEHWRTSVDDIIQKM